jgi:uncharacterized protein YkuJ
MQQKKSTLVYRTDLVNIGIGQGQRESVPYLASQTEYDENGRVILQSSFSPDGLLTEKVLLEYDENGHVVHETYFIDEGDPTEEKSYEFDENGRVVRQLKHYIDGSADTTSYAYNQDGLPTEKITINEDDEVEAKETFTYNGKKLIKHEMVDQEENILLSEEFLYDEKGNMVEHIKDDEESGEYFKLVTKYNEDGRKLAEMIYSEDDTLFETTWFEEDSQGRVVQTVEENDRSRRVKNFHFDEKGNNLGYEETNGNGDKMVVVEHLYDPENNTVSSMVFVNGGGRGMSQHYELNYEYEWY